MGLKLTASRRESLEQVWPFSPGADVITHADLHHTRITDGEPHAGRHEPAAANSRNTNLFPRHGANKGLSIHPPGPHAPSIELAGIEPGTAISFSQGKGESAPKVAFTSVPVALSL
jgi:hypothetical protein